MEERKIYTEFCGKHEGKDYFQDLHLVWMTR